jgi:hypothetical protein
MVIVQRKSGTVTLKKDKQNNGHRTEGIRYSNFEEGQTKQWSSNDVFCFSSLCIHVSWDTSIKASVLHLD